MIVRAFIINQLSERRKRLHDLLLTLINKDNEFELCQTKGISGFPSWEINGEIISGTRALNELATKTDYQGDLNF